LGKVQLEQSCAIVWGGTDVTACFLGRFVGSYGTQPSSLVLPMLGLFKVPVGAHFLQQTYPVVAGEVLRPVFH